MATLEQRYLYSYENLYMNGRKEDLPKLCTDYGLRSLTFIRRLRLQYTDIVKKLFFYFKPSYLHNGTLNQKMQIMLMTMALNTLT